MGTQAQTLVEQLDKGTELIQDLKVTILRSSTVVPVETERTERRSFFLSNIDQVLNFDVDTLHFFSANPSFPADVVTLKLEDALRRVLVPYDFMAGRLKYNPNEDRLEIDCNFAGVLFTVASSELELHQLGDLVYPNPAFHQLVPTKNDKLDLQDRPLLHLQVTFFKCGSFVMSISNNHTTFDGLSAKAFFDNLASLIDSKLPLSHPPFNNRRLLSSRSPPVVTFSHPELLILPPPPPPSSTSPSTQPIPSTLLDSSLPNTHFKVFHLSPSHISLLKSQSPISPPPSSFNVVTAHIWRCKILATTTTTTTTPDPQATTSVLFAVDIRPRLKPPLPRSYTGNAVLTGYGEATRKELDGPFAKLVEAVHEGVTRMTDEYARSVIDWGQLHKGFPRGDVFISSWWRLGLEEVDYPWGKPIYSCPVMIPNSDIVLLLPEMKHGDDHNKSLGQGVNVCVALSTEDIQRFESLFYKFLA